MIWVTPQSKLNATLQTSGARHVIAFASPGSEHALPAALDAKDCLVLTMNDIISPVPDLLMPRREQVESLLAFDHALPADVPLVLTCYAGVSRSTAGAYILACRRQNSLDETALANLLRDHAPFATPNACLIALADELLARDGRMIRAIRDIGRGADAFEGTPFSISWAFSRWSAARL